MRRVLSAYSTILVALLAACSLFVSPCWAQDRPFERGRVLFNRTWQARQARYSQPDGLGPLFNERSCAACHQLGGIGGAGPREKNIDLITPAVSADELSIEELAVRLRKLHPALTTDASLVLHRFGTTGQRYDDFRTVLLGIDAPIEIDPLRRATFQIAAAHFRPSAPIKVIHAGGARIIWTQRSTTALFGLGQIARIAESDIRLAAARQSRELPDITGRFAGRFGWRGQIDDLGTFVRAACATELGLQVATHSQAIDPLAAGHEVRAASDISPAECNDLTAFVARLPRPRQVLPHGHQAVTRVREGEAIFKAIGCADCHLPRLGNVAGLYSDLLLHDLGDRLSDPSPAPPNLRLSRQSEGGYSSRIVLVNQPSTFRERMRQWKTPPLWGLRDSGPYLHDGRAETIEEAVAFHGGEAERSANGFLRLAADDRQQLLAFLATLAAPDPATLP